MRGHRHKLRLIGARVQSGADEGKVVRDTEGRWLQSPDNPPQDILVRDYVGFIGAPRVSEVAAGRDVDSAAHLPARTVIVPGDELEAWDTGDPNLDGRYEIVGIQPGKALTRVLLKRHTL